MEWQREFGGLAAGGGGCGSSYFNDHHIKSDAPAYPSSNSEADRSGTVNVHNLLLITYSIFMRGVGEAARCRISLLNHTLKYKRGRLQTGDVKDEERRTEQKRCVTMTTIDTTAFNERNSNFAFLSTLFFGTDVDCRVDFD